MASFIRTAAIAVLLIAHTALAVPTHSLSSVQHLARRAGGLISTCSAPGQFALTFDDGPYIYNDAIRAELAKQGIKATFFVNGKNNGDITQYGPQLNALIAEGHQLASHGYSHCDLNTGCNLQQEIDGLEDAIAQLTGKRVRYFRPPFGNYPDSAASYLDSKGYVSILWNADSLDWQTPNDPQGNVERALNDVRANPGNGPIILSHEIVATVVEYIGPVVAGLKALGYTKGVTVAECTGQGSPYRDSEAAVASGAAPPASGTPAPAPATSTAASGPAPTGGSTYPLCPADKALTGGDKQPDGRYVWKTPEGQQCSGCPGEGYQTKWDAGKQTCVSVNSF